MRKLPHKCTGMGLHSAMLVSFTISFVVIFVIKKKKNYKSLTMLSYPVWKQLREFVEQNWKSLFLYGELCSVFIEKSTCDNFSTFSGTIAL